MTEQFTGRALRLEATGGGVGALLLKVNVGYAAHDSYPRSLAAKRPLSS